MKHILDPEAARIVRRIMTEHRGDLEIMARFPARPRIVIADGLGPELHESGDFAADDRGETDGRRLVVDEGPKYPNRDTIYRTPGARDWDDYPETGDQIDVGEMLQLTDLLHESNASLERRREDGMSPEKLIEMVERAEAGDLGEGHTHVGGSAGLIIRAPEIRIEGHERTAAGTSPSREVNNTPSVVIEEARVRLEHKMDRLEERDGELSNEDEATLHLLEEEGDRRGIEARRARTAGEIPPQFLKGKGDGEGDEKKPAVEAKPPAHHDPRSPEAIEHAEDEAIDRIEEAVQELMHADIDDAAMRSAHEIDEAVDDLMDIQDGEEAAMGMHGGGHSPSKPKSKEKDDDEDDGDKKEAALTSVSPASWGRAVTAAFVRVEDDPDRVEMPHLAVGSVKEAAEDLPFDLFESSPDRYTTAERALASMAVNRRAEVRARFQPPSPRLVDAAAGQLKQAVAQLRKGYSIDLIDLKHYTTTKVAAADGRVMEGEFVWGVRLADHARGRRGYLDMTLAIVDGAPAGEVHILADGRRIPFTRRAIDEHLNVRRDATVRGHRGSHVERAIVPE